MFHFHYFCFWHFINTVSFISVYEQVLWSLVTSLFCANVGVKDTVKHKNVAVYDTDTFH